jgi:acylphosphatase
MHALRITVRGRVQGVGFRWFVREIARRADLAGWVRNCPDGSVELAASGSEDALMRLLDALRRGPDHARVDEVRQCPLDTDEGLTRPFAVLR